ncbi:hypothetical protein VTJ49DRAFT_2458 [Mycothermus thermophilus]|uniref:Uncharacterized protein n=1 Tax=Humicola insolens TaxID=85995 RepID=A0ABR3VB62_HUMIN
MHFTQLTSRALMGGLMWKTLPKHSLNSTSNHDKRQWATCDLGLEPCGNLCVPPMSSCCVIFGFDTYCDPGYDCTYDGGCCVRGACGGDLGSCNIGSEECNGSCMPESSVCCRGELGWCPSGWECGGDGRCYRDTLPTGCGDEEPCPDGYTCGDDGSCYPDDVEPGCDEGFAECDGNFCMEADGVCCGTGQGYFCSAGYYCVSEGEGCCKDGEICESGQTTAGNNKDPIPNPNGNDNSGPTPTKPGGPGATSAGQKDEDENSARTLQILSHIQHPILHRDLQRRLEHRTLRVRIRSGVQQHLDNLQTSNLSRYHQRRPTNFVGSFDALLSTGPSVLELITRETRARTPDPYRIRRAPDLEQSLNHHGRSRNRCKKQNRLILGRNIGYSSPEVQEKVRRVDVAVVGGVHEWCPV